MKKFRYYVPDSEGNGLIQVEAKKRPSKDTVPRHNESWIVDEYVDGNWRMACFPEISWHTLKDFVYLGEIKI